MKENLENAKFCLSAVCYLFMLQSLNKLNEIWHRDSLKPGKALFILEYYIVLEIHESNLT